MIYNEITKTIIGCAFRVHNNLGAGFLEKVYERALKIELMKAGLLVQCQCPLTVFYGDEIVGNYYADLIVEDSIIVELKATQALTQAHEIQLINYLKATRKEIGLLINFCPSVEIKRKYLHYSPKGFGNPQS